MAKDSQQDRQNRLAAALRENLKRRKARERALITGKTASSGDTPRRKGGRGPNAAKNGA